MQPPERATAQAVERVFREQYGRILATLIRVPGDFEFAEDALQEAFIAAVEHWQIAGIPDNAAAWLTTAARNKALSRLRRESTQSKLRDQQAHIPYRVPPDHLLPERLASVLAVVYLIFNEG